MKDRDGANAARFLTAEWLDLAMLNYEIDPAVLEPLVPAGTELDSWSGRTLVSIVGFHFRGTRMLGLPVPFHRNFEEINLRFYVRRFHGGEWRRGVVFVKEIVPRMAIAWTARALYNENYVALRTRRAITNSRVEYGWHDERWHGMHADFADEWQVPADDSEETFITEHYWGYARQRDGGTVEYRVEHPRWPVAAAIHAALDCDAAAIYGAKYAPYLAGTPTSAFVAKGSAVTVRRGVRMR